MKSFMFTLFNEGLLFRNIAKKLNIDIETVQFREFPDEETYIKVNANVKDRICLIFESLNNPNNKILPIIFLAETLRDLGAKNIGLIAPYLAYMRQDKRFQPGEGITSKYFAKLLSGNFDWLITVDPHLHRLQTLNEIYSISSTVIHSTENIAHWVKLNVKTPLLIGPDIESEQWVSAIAKIVNVPYIILEKIRYSDRDVEISIPEVKRYLNHTPVLVDDIISTAQTMLKTIDYLKVVKMKAPICIGVHALFSGDSYKALLDAGVEKVVTCNSVDHISNQIDLSIKISKGIKQQLDRIL